MTTWERAEEQVARRLASIMGLPYGRRLFVGDATDAEGKVNVVLFCVAGGGDQDQAWQAGASAWNTEGRLFGVFTERRDALRAGACLLDEDAVPFAGGAGTAMPHVAKVFLRTHPTISRRAGWRVARRKGTIRAAVMECTLGVVYQE